MIHYQLTRQERTQVTGRWHEGPAPLCSTSDGHYRGVNPATWTGTLPPVTCPRCCERNHLVAPRERNLVSWKPLP